MIKLKYSNRELSDTVKNLGLNLSSKTIYYYSITDLPDNMIQKQFFVDRYHYPLKVGDILFNSERQCVATFIACLLEDGLNNFITSDFLLGLSSKCVIRDVYESKTPCGSSLVLKNKRPMDVFEKSLCDRWMLFFHMTACRYKFSTISSHKPHEELMRTGDKFLCYAHMNDKEYGIYMSPQSAAMKITDPNDWLGLNVHGRILMMVRDELRSVPLKKIEIDMDNPVSIIIRCEYPGLLNIHLDMCEYLLGMEKGVISLSQINKNNMNYLYEVVVRMQKVKNMSVVISRLKELILNYPELEII